MSYVVRSNGTPFSESSTSVRQETISVAFKTLQVSHSIVDSVGPDLSIVISFLAVATCEMTSGLACPRTWCN